MTRCERADVITHIGPWCYCRQRPTLPHSFPCSTIGGSRLNFRVRNGNGCDPAPMTTGKLAAWGPPLRSLDELRGTSLRWLANRSAEGAEVGSSQTILMSKNLNWRLNILQTAVFPTHFTQSFLRALVRNNLWSSLTA